MIQFYPDYKSSGTLTTDVRYS